MKSIRKMLKNDKGATAIEYGLIAVAAIGAMSTLGTSLKETFSATSGALDKGVEDSKK